MSRGDLEGKAPDVLVVVNPTATRYPGDALRQALRDALRSRGLKYRIFEFSPSSEDARPAVRRAIRRALAEGAERVIAVGGDGTVSMVAEGLTRNRKRFPEAVLGIIPAGTANVLARELGIPVLLEEAAAAAAGSGAVLALDAILAGGRSVLTQVGIGPDAVMIRDTSRESQAKLGRFAYVAAFLRRARRQRPHRFELEIDGTTVRVRGWQIVVANAGSMGAPPFTWGPRIDPTDGTVDLCVFDVRAARDYLVLAWRILAGRHRRDASTRYFRVREEVTIRTQRPALVQGDGEIIGKTPITLRVAPGALRVIVTRDVGGAVPASAPGAALASAEVSSGERPASSVAAAAEAVARDVQSMLAQHSRTWVLQGVLRHPIAALEALDAALFLRMNALSLGSVVDRMLTWVSRIMLYGEGWAIVILVMVVADFWAGLRAAAEAFPVIGATMLTVNYPAKRFFRRRRPFIAFVKARILGPRPRDFSFPSGHAAAGFAGAVTLAPHAPGWSPLFYFIGVIMALSRVYLGVHYPSDVAFGALLGAVLAALYRALIHALLPGIA